MTGQEINIIIQLLKVACPHLQRMATASDNPFDDIIVGIVCAFATLDVFPEEIKIGGKDHG